MLKLKVWYIDSNDYLNRLELPNIVIYRCMCSWSFNKLLKYINNELKLFEINKSNISCIELYNDFNRWLCVENKRNKK